MAFVLYRLSLDDPLAWHEQQGDPITNTGGAAVPAIRSALRHSASISTLTPVPSDSVAERLKIRRQLRSLANNTPMKLTGFYLAWATDPEQNGWYAPDQGQLVDGDGSSGMATGWFKMENFVWFVLGKARTHRRAVWVFMKDLRTGLSARDYRRLIFSTDFSGLSALALSYFPSGLSAVSSAVTGAAVPLISAPAGEDGGKPDFATGLLDEIRVSYEQAEANRNLAQVLVYDRRGQFTRPSGGPGTEWEEFYGPDYPYAWVGPGASAIDAPVLDNGQCRVTYDSTNTPGFRIEVWNGAWSEQCKVNIYRQAEVTGFCNELLSASLVEYNETRSIVKALMRNSADAASQEEVFITLERGWSGPRFEVYPALNAAGVKTDALIYITLAAADTDDSAIKIDAAGAGAIQATATGTGHTGLFANSNIGASSFTGENEVIVGRWKGTSETTLFGLTVAVVQAAALAATQSAETVAYGSARNAIYVTGNGQKLGYMSAQLGFPAQVPQQAQEAENMTLGTGTANTADAAAANGKAATATRTTDANPHVSQTKWPSNDWATYRVFARVKTSVGSSKWKLYAKTGATTGATKEGANTAYEWVDLGDIVANETTLEIHAWLSAAGTVSVDRVEAFLLEDRQTAHGGIYRGGRDLGQACLYDSRTIPTLVTRGS